MSFDSYNPFRCDAATLPMPLLRLEVEEKLFSGIPFIQFLVDVCGTDEKHIEFILGQKWTLLENSLNQYEHATVESDMYEPFAAISYDLLAETTRRVRREFYPESDPTPTVNSILFWHERGYHPLLGHAAIRQPDIAVIGKDFGPTSKKPLWCFVRNVFEFKRRFESSKDLGSSDVAPISRAVPSLPHAGSSLSGPSHVGSSSISTSRSRSKRSCPTEPIRHSERIADKHDSTSSPVISFVPSAVLPPAKSKKRKNTQSQSGGDTKRHRTEKTTTNLYGPTGVSIEHLQLAAYALECLAASTRYYFTGLWIDRFGISLWYFDRACIVRTDAFDFKSNPEFLAAVLYALSVCDDRHAGFDPHLSAFPRRPERPERTYYHWQDIAGLEMNLPPSDAYPGRGKYHIKDTIYGYRGLIGRGTMVYRVRPLISDGLDHESEVLKLSWPLLIRPLETTIIDQIRTSLPEKWREHIPEVTYSYTFTADDLKLPRIKLLDMSVIKEFEDRHLHVLSMKPYKKIWEAADVEEFKDIFVDCIECHHYAYKQGRVLHRDLSEHNLMFKYGANGETIGILSDWDMASFVNDRDEVVSSAATHRTGTVPFMARDLLVDDDEVPPPHLYRHDLESFFYILVWAAVHYDFVAKKRIPTKELGHIQEWDGASFHTAQTSKAYFIVFAQGRDDILRFVQPSCQALIPWINSLWDIFFEAATGAQRALRSGSVWDNDTLGGNLTFEKFMEAIGRVPRSFNS